MNLIPRQIVGKLQNTRNRDVKSNQMWKAIAHKRQWLGGQQMLTSKHRSQWTTDYHQGPGKNCQPKFLFWWGRGPAPWRFLGQGSKLHHSSELSHCSDHVHRVTRELQPELLNLIYLFIYLLSFCLFRAALAACGGSQARGSNQNCSWQPTPQLMATPDP